MANNPAEVPTLPSTGQMTSSNVFRINWKSMGWGKRIGIGIALLFVAFGCIGIFLMAYYRSLNALYDTLAVWLEGLGLLTILNSRFKGLGVTIFLLGVFIGTVPNVHKGDAVGAGFIIIASVIYWLVRLIVWVLHKVQKPRAVPSRT